MTLVNANPIVDEVISGPRNEFGAFVAGSVVGLLLGLLFFPVHTIVFQHIEGETGPSFTVLFAASSIGGAVAGAIAGALWGTIRDKPQLPCSSHGAVGGAVASFISLFLVTTMLLLLMGG
jgi:hypothetical protein